jgi:hypothetical protein
VGLDILCFGYMSMPSIVHYATLIEMFQKLRKQYFYVSVFTNFLAH